MAIRRIWKFAAIVILGLIATSVGLIISSGIIPKPFVCGHPTYKNIAPGLTKANITKLLGKPSRVGVNHGDPNFMGQQNPAIAEVWMYFFLIWEGHIEVYFDSTDHVLGRNCGNG